MHGSSPTKAKTKAVKDDKAGSNVGKQPKSTAVKVSDAEGSVPKDKQTKTITKDKVTSTMSKQPKSKTAKEAKLNAVKDTNVNSSSESLLGNKFLSISLDRSDVDRYLFISHDQSSEHPCVDSDSSKDIAISRRRHGVLKCKPPAVKIIQKLKVPKLVEGKQLCSRVVTIKQEPFDDNDVSSTGMKPTTRSSHKPAAPK